MAENITPEEYAAWISPSQASSSLRPGSGWGDAIVNRIATGSLRAAARRVTEVSSVGARPVEMCSFVVLLPGRWIAGQTMRFWQYGDFTEDAHGFESACPGMKAGRPGSKRFFEGVRFDPEGLRLLRSQLPAPPIKGLVETMAAGFAGQSANWADRAEEAPIARASATERHAGGRPSLAFWEDAIIAVAKDIYFAKLQPKRQADVERALAAWIEDNGHTASEAPIRQRARKLWQAMKEDEN